MELTGLLETGFKEDLGFGDLTSESIYHSLESERTEGRFIVRKPGVLAGVQTIAIGYGLLDSEISVTQLKQDGERVEPGDTIARVEGPASELLSGERVILNTLQHLSGIATTTRRAVDAVGHQNTRICDTRKTLPGWRALQKYAVRCGGGWNHRFRLDDAVMIKENHIAASGSIQNAVESVRMRAGHMVRIEVECETEDQIRQAVDLNVDAILIDNQPPEEAKRLCKVIPETIVTELSGGITPDTVHLYRDTGANYISIGSLTHSVQALDISLLFKGSVKRN